MQQSPGSSTGFSRFTRFVRAPHAALMQSNVVPNATRHWYGSNARTPVPNWHCLRWHRCTPYGCAPLVPQMTVHGSTLCALYADYCSRARAGSVRGRASFSLIKKKGWHCQRCQAVFCSEACKTTHPCLDRPQEHARAIEGKRKYSVEQVDQGAEKAEAAYQKNHNKVAKPEEDPPGEDTPAATPSGGTAGGLLFEGAWQPQLQLAGAGAGPGAGPAAAAGAGPGPAAAAPLSPPSLSLQGPSLSSQQLPLLEPSASVQLQLQRSPVSLHGPVPPPPPHALGQVPLLVGDPSQSAVTVPAGIQGLWEAQLAAARPPPSEAALSGGPELSTGTIDGGQLPVGSPMPSSALTSTAHMDFLALFNNLQGTSAQQQPQQQQAGVPGFGVHAWQASEASRQQQQGFMQQQPHQQQQQGAQLGGCSLPRSASASPGHLPAASVGYAQAFAPGSSGGLQHSLGWEAPPQPTPPPPQIRVVSCEEACRRADQEGEPLDLRATLAPLCRLSSILLDWVLQQAATQVEPCLVGLESFFECHGIEEPLPLPPNSDGTYSPGQPVCGTMLLSLVHQAISALEGGLLDPKHRAAHLAAEAEQLRRQQSHMAEHAQRLEVAAQQAAVSSGRQRKRSWDGQLLYSSSSSDNAGLEGSSTEVEVLEARLAVVEAAVQRLPGGSYGEGGAMVQLRAQVEQHCSSLLGLLARSSQCELHTHSTTQAGVQAELSDMLSQPHFRGQDCVVVSAAAAAAAVPGSDASLQGSPLTAASQPLSGLRSPSSRHSTLAAAAAAGAAGAPAPAGSGGTSWPAVLALLSPSLDSPHPYFQLTGGSLTVAGCDHQALTPAAAVGCEWVVALGAASALLVQRMMEYHASQSPAFGHRVRSANPIHQALYRMALNMASTCQQSALERVGYTEEQLPLHLDKEDEEVHLATSGHPSLAHPGPTLASISEEGQHSLLRVRPSQELSEASRSPTASAVPLLCSPLPALAGGRFDPGSWDWQNTTAWALTDPLSAPLLQPAVQEGRGARLPGVVGMTFGVGALSAASSLAVRVENMCAGTVNVCHCGAKLWVLFPGEVLEAQGRDLLARLTAKQVPPEHLLAQPELLQHARLVVQLPQQLVFIRPGSTYHGGAVAGMCLGESANHWHLHKGDAMAAYGSQTGLAHSFSQWCTLGAQLQGHPASPWVWRSAAFRGYLQVMRDRLGAARGAGAAQAHQAVEYLLSRL